MKREEGFLKTSGGKVWYEIVGDSVKTPLLVIHGGPGYPHDYLEPLSDLANSRKVIFYDQLDCGNSQRVKNKSLWTLEYFTEELEQLTKELGLKQYHILGHSWGSGLGLAFALKKPKGLSGLILADPYISTPLWEKDAMKLLGKFSKKMRETLLKNDAESEGYKNAWRQFYYKHVFMMKELPVHVLKSEHKMNVELYNYMWGPAEFKPTGTLIDFDLAGRLHEIKIPVLLLCGRFDEATPATVEYFKNQIPNAKMEVFEKSAHFPHWTERKEYIETVRSFLNSL